MSQDKSARTGEIEAKGIGANSAKVGQEEINPASVLKTATSPEINPSPERPQRICRQF